MLEKITELANKEKKISDFHLREGSDIAYRILGDIVIQPNSKISDKDFEELLKKNLDEEEIKKFYKKKELDAAVMLGDLRFRANFYMTLNGTGAVLRRVETKAPLMDNLNLPPILYELLDTHKGLVLVTGPTGSGKSTTLAAIINQINESRQSNIITIEDPVEFVHHDRKSIISQREVGKQTNSFSNALKAALREDPDVILVGELRDLETIGLALTAAETGHLVFGTLHTSGAPNTINRIIDVFPPEQQNQIRAQIAESFEVMVFNAPIKNLIWAAKIHQIPTVMQTAQREGMIQMEKSIEDLIASNQISNAEKNN